MIHCALSIHGQLHYDVYASRNTQIYGHLLNAVCPDQGVEEEVHQSTSRHRDDSYLLCTRRTSCCLLYRTEAITLRLPLPISKHGEAAAGTNEAIKNAVCVCACVRMRKCACVSVCVHGVM